MHITHPSNVRPGWSADFVGGISNEHYRAEAECNNCPGDEPASGDIHVLQINVAWAKRLESGNAFRGGLMIPLAMNNGSALGAMGGTTLDVYYQFMNSPFNIGAGGLVGFVNSGVYIETGKTLYPAGGFELDIDIGLSAEIALFTEPGIRPFFVVGLTGERWKAGVWADYLEYKDYLKRCDESCNADDYLENSVSGGLFIGTSF